MAGPDAGAFVSVEVLVEQDQVTPVWIVLKLLGAPEDGAPAGAIVQEDPGEAPRELGGHLPQVQFPTRARRALDGETLAVEVVELLERLDEQIVHGEPDRAAPIRVAAEETTGGFGRLVVD